MYVNGRICFVSATPTCMGDHLESGGPLVEVKWKWMWLRHTGREESSSVVAPQGKAIPHSLAYHLFALHVS